MKIPPKTKAAGWGAKAAFDTTHYASHVKPKSGLSQRLNKDKLPTPFNYYRKQFSGLHQSGEWVNVTCCFHSDKNPSLSLNLQSGGFFCHACGAKGGDVIAFHRQRFSLGFIEAVAQLLKIRLGELK